MDVDLELGPAPHQSPGGRGVVEVNVGEQQRPRLLIADRLYQRLHRGLRAGVDEGAVNLPAADHMRPSQMHNVDDAH